MNQDIQQIQVSIDECKEKIALGECLKRLSKNRDFKKLIEQVYFKDEAHRLTMVKASPNCQDEAIQKEIIKDIDGIGSLYQFFCAIGTEAQTMAHNLAQHELMRDELEEADED